ncbi:MAG: tetratricopeptide repeat protein [Bacteroidales bacterium]|nr:tetratricopeptide repeat protein [Bacteroidales bacterium]
MKHTLILTIAALLAIGAVGCQQRKAEEELTDAEKLELLDLKLERSPKDATLLAKRAKVLLDLGRTQEAMFDIGKAVSIDPDNVDYLLLQADVLFANRETDKCLQTLNHAEELAPDSKEVQLKLGELTFYRNDFDRSLRHLSNVTAKEPDNRTALFMKGFIYLEKGDTAEAVTLFRRVCDIYPDYELAFEELGVLYAERKNPMAVEYLTTAAKLEPSNTNVLYNLGKYYQDIEEYSTAEQYYHQLLDINPASADAWHNLGYIELFVYSDIDQAIEYFDKALEADPTHEASQTNRELAIQIKKS